jgi:vacuolar-type H+-ATPase catalytic subunit A/Vma1
LLKYLKEPFIGIRFFGAIIQKIAKSSRETRGVLRQISKEASIVAVAVLGNVLPAEGDFALRRLIETLNKLRIVDFPIRLSLPMRSFPLYAK